MKQSLPWWELQRQARRSLPSFLADYVDAGAGAGQAIDRNQRDLQALRFWPRPLGTGGAARAATHFLDRPCAMPVAIAPTGLNDLLHPHGDLLLARAAQAAAIPFVQSSASLTPPAALSAHGIKDAWQQVYVHDRTTLLADAARLADAGTAVLVVTVDVPVGGVRWHERRLPPRLRPSRATIPAILARPAWVLRHARARATGSLRYQQPLSDRVLNRQFDLELDWSDIAALRKTWPGRLLIKGLLHPLDLALAQDAGCDGAVVSNHGGRQLESAASAWSSLAAARQAVGRDFTLLADGGVRTGEDVVKALALGADGVLIGRLVLWALAAGGGGLLDLVLADLKRQVETAMQLCGFNSVAAMIRHGHQQLVQPSGQVP